LPFWSSIYFLTVSVEKLEEKPKFPNYGLRFVETEESYTSKASFVDRDFLPTIGTKPEGWKESGKGIKRGLYRTGLQNWCI
jgi:hypothetical protein